VSALPQDLPPSSATGGQMRIGLSTYTYLWRMSDRVPTPMRLGDVVDDAATRDVDLVQICDRPELEDLPETRLGELRARAGQAGLGLEVGTRGIDPPHLLGYLELAHRLVTMVRSMVSAEQAASPDRAVAMLREVGPAYADAGVELALETYEQIRTADLVRLVTDTGFPGIGICLDPGNSRTPRCPPNATGPPARCGSSTTTRRPHDRIPDRAGTAGRDTDAAVDARSGPEAPFHRD